MNVRYCDLPAQHRTIKSELVQAIDRVLESGDFILGEEVEAFERDFAAYIGTLYAVGVGSGTDALILSLRAIGISDGDEVITVPNSFVASVAAICLVGAVPVLVDVRPDYNVDPRQVEDAITEKTKAILPVHLTGRPADMQSIMEIADRYRLQVIEDAAQAVGAVYQDRKVGAWGTAGCFSLHPLKNLNACGDGGIITTNDRSVYEYVKEARNHGLRTRGECAFWGLNSRLDSLQAALLRVKLRYLDRWTEVRRANASYYQRHLADIVAVPKDSPHEQAVYQTFAVQADRRDRLKDHLTAAGIETKIHYPVPIHLQNSARELGYGEGSFPVAERQANHTLSLPIHPELTPAELELVQRCIREFYEGDC